MKQKVSRKPTLVLMAGLPGVGKTTLALALGSRLGWAVVDKDGLKAPFLEVPLLKGKFDEDSAGWAAYEYSLNVTEHFLVKQQLSVILDTSLLHPFILDQAKKLTARSGAQLKILLCEVDEPTRRHRLRTRKASISQSKGHLVPKEGAKQFEEFDPSLYRRIWTKRPLKAYVEEALMYVMEYEQVQEAIAHQSGSSTWFNRLRTLLLFFFG